MKNEKEEEDSADPKVSKSSLRSAGSGDAIAAGCSDGRQHHIEPNMFLFQHLTHDEHGARETGLPNLGLTCYRNSVYQVLAESPNFFGTLKGTIEYDMTEKEEWTFTLCEILWRILSKSTLRPDIDYWLCRLQTAFAAVDTSFVEYRQNDSLSFFTSLMCGITDVLQKRRKQYSVKLNDPSEIFRGQLHDKYTCCKCKQTEYHATSDFFSLPLPTVESQIPKIGDCLFQFLSAETLKDVFLCSFCNHGIVEKEIKIKKYPEILVLQFGMVSGRENFFQRAHKVPKFGEDFNGLSNNIHLTKIDKGEFSKYTLYGVIAHTGGLTEGHYYAYVKRLDSEEWELCDDSYVHRVDVKEVLCSEAYILFYHKVEKFFKA
ncbi:uncharacterized protein LOC125659598 [Ostrea edulis]|uniref:uncharacterized protein LOC125659598 n=1 Tax=Ostrea edulis TaxID=37623 RepID=UPI0024AF74BC|nr:uncharacterized protein LOC125659598 [Ostrea edulis]